VRAALSVLRGGIGNVGGGTREPTLPSGPPTWAGMGADAWYAPDTSIVTTVGAPPASCG